MHVPGIWWSLAWLILVATRLPVKSCGGQNALKSLKDGGFVRSAKQAIRPAFLLMLLLPFRCADAAESLEIGVWPYMSTQALLTLYHPLQIYLEHRLQRPVLFVTARDQKTFVDRTERGEYRFVVTAPHFARLAQKEAGYVPMLRPERNLICLLLVDSNSPMLGIGDLRGKRVTLPGKFTIVSMLTLWALRASGMEPGRDFTVRYAESHNNAVLDVLRGESSAAAVAATILDQMPADEKGKVRVLAMTGEVTPLVWLANPEVPRKEISDMSRIILDFAENTRDGAKFMKKLAWHGLRAPTEKEMQSLDPYVAELNKLLKSNR